MLPYKGHVSGIRTAVQTTPSNTHTGDTLCKPRNIELGGREGHRKERREEEHYRKGLGNKGQTAD